MGHLSSATASPVEASAALVRWRGESEAELGRSIAEAARDGAREAARDVLVRAEHPPRATLASCAAGAGASALALGLHGARAEVHEWHAGAGSFAPTLAAMAAARSLGLGIVAWTALTRSSAGTLTELPGLLKARGVGLWAIVVAASDDRAPRFGMAGPRALAALEAARRLGVPTRIVGMPSCVAGPLASAVVAGSPRTFDARCEGCVARPGCAGVDAAYLGRFGATELRPLREAPAAPSPNRWSAALEGLEALDPAGTAMLAT